MAKIIHFPQDFLWGSATSAYQVEGGIENSDWSRIFPAGLACDHYRLYEKDFDLLKELSQNAYRFSIEWSRIEPTEGRFNEKEIEHYRRVLKALRERGVKSMVTLHHFTLPLWLARRGGFANSQSVFYFSRFAEKMFKEYGEIVDFWVTLNEPLIYATVMAPLLKKKNGLGLPDLPAILLTIKNEISAHRKTHEVFHRLAKESKTAVYVGIAKNNAYFVPFNPKSFLDRLAVGLCRYFWNGYFLDRIKDRLDFIGLNYYFHHQIKFPFFLKQKKKLISDLGWEVFPEGIYHALLELKKYQLPIYITENGVADAEDKLREEFIEGHLSWIGRAIEEEVDVRGYFHWSLIDNFEWDKGFGPRFGLIEIDYETMERKIRPSAREYAKISRENKLVQ
ncbi:MAG: glycoside hydrolase family 1 protein [bacterium]|nr:glycoside hydrolase family 1 protein [bacterium]